jgi:hypothetical protein
MLLADGPFLTAASRQHLSVSISCTHQASSRPTRYTRPARPQHSRRPQIWASTRLCPRPRRLPPAPRPTCYQEALWRRPAVAGAIVLLAAPALAAGRRHTTCEHGRRVTARSGRGRAAGGAGAARAEDRRDHAVGGRDVRVRQGDTAECVFLPLSNMCTCY